MEKSLDKDSSSIKGIKEGFNDAARTARIALCILLCVLIAGLFRVSIDGDPVQLVASDSDRFKAFETRVKQFPAEQRQVHVFTQGPVLDSEHLRRYEEAATAISELEDVRFVGSLFSPPTLASPLQSIIEDPDGSIESGLVDDVKALLARPDFLPSRMVSESLDAAQMSITLVSADNIEHNIELIHSVLTDAYPASSGIAWSLVGNPIIEQAIERDVLQELLRVTIIAALFGALVAAWVVRDLKSIAVLLSVPTAAVLATIGFMGWLGISLTLLSQAVMIVVFLVVFTDTLHTLKSSRSRSSLVLACGLTSLTTGAAAIALWFASSVVIQNFSMTLMAGIAIGFAVWFLWLVGWGEMFKARRAQEHDQDQDQDQVIGQRHSDWLVHSQLETHSRWLLVGLSLCVLLVFATQLRTGFSLTENLPRSHELASALTLVEEDFSGYLPLQMVVSTDDSNMAVEPFLENVATLQSALNDVEDQSTDVDLRWYSLIDVAALTPGVSFEDRLSLLPKPLLETLWKDSKEVVLFGPKSLRAWLATPAGTVEALDDRVQGLAQELNLTAGPVTGMPVLVREASTSLFGDAWRSVLLTVLVLCILVAAVLRSVRFAWLAGLPVVFGLSAYAASLVVLGEPLRHAGVVMMTLVIGLSVDNALHLIVSARQGGEHKKRVINECLTVSHVATLVSIAGFIALAFSAIPSVGVLGFSASVGLAVGFLATVFCLPPMLIKRL